MRMRKIAWKLAKMLRESGAVYGISSSTWITMMYGTARIDIKARQTGVLITLSAPGLEDEFEINAESQLKDAFTRILSRLESA